MEICTKSFNKTGITYNSLLQSARHYKGERGFCTCIAVAVATGCKFGKARSLMARHGRQTGRGSSPVAVKQAIEFAGFDCEFLGLSESANAPTEHYYRHNGFDTSKKIKGFTLKTSANRLSKDGIYLVYSNSHVACVKGGVIEDWATDSKKRMEAVFEVKVKV